MSWNVEFRPEVRDDIAEAAGWYEAREPGLGGEFTDEVIALWKQLTKNPLIGSGRDPTTGVRWRYPERFPYRVIYEVDEVQRCVLVVAVLHAAREGIQWRTRL